MKKQRDEFVEELPEHTDGAEEAEAGETDSEGAGFPGPSERADSTRVEGSRPDSSESKAERERDEYKDLLLRKTAEFDNFRKRTGRERQTQSETAAFNFVQELLPLLDDLERALSVDAGTGGADAYRKGVELIHRQLLDFLRRRGVKPIDALGAMFDPHYHQAVSYEPASDNPDGQIVEEFRRGYTLGDRLLRPSMVKVAKG